MPFVFKGIPELGVTTLAEMRGFSEILWKEDTAGHYRHMSGGNFLVSLREIDLFEKNN